MTITPQGVPMESEEAKVNSMSSKIEARLRSLLLQFRAEAGVFDRIIYKNKNQHRRAPYFQYLLKVRRDVRLFLSAELGDILKFLFPIVDEKKPACEALLPMHSKKRVYRTKYSYQERLLGIARLLSQMVEPVLKAAIQISLLLAKSFFAGFCITTLALLARFRVLVQQMLLDVVFIFNKVSSLSQEKQEMKISLDGLEAFRECYPTTDKVMKLECHWEADKFVLHEKILETTEREQNTVLEAVPSTTTVQYNTTDIFYEGLGTKDGSDSQKILYGAEAGFSRDTDLYIENLFELEKQIATGSSAEQLLSVANDKVESAGAVPLKKSDVAAEGILGSNVFPHSQTESQSTSKKVAFITVKRTIPSETKENNSCKKTKLDLLPKDEKVGSLELTHKDE